MRGVVLLTAASMVLGLVMANGPAPSITYWQSRFERGYRFRCGPYKSPDKSCQMCACDGTDISPYCLLTCPGPAPKAAQSQSLTAAGHKLEKKTMICTPMTTFKEDCNTCFCNIEGTSALCTLINCRDQAWFSAQLKSLTGAGHKLEEKIMTCTPMTSFMVECNTCLCSSDGTMAKCTRKRCNDKHWISAQPPGLIGAGLKWETRHMACEPNTTFKEACNRCICNSNGTWAMCTRMACDGPYWAAAQALGQFQAERNLEVKPITCTPYTTFKEDCNICHCNVGGTSATCMVMDCNELQPLSAQQQGEIDAGDKYVTIKNSCTPYTTFKDDCNTCSCNSDGTNAWCMAKRCSNQDWASAQAQDQFDAQFNLEIRPMTCTPNTTFKDDCNICLCNVDGTSATCTKMVCSGQKWVITIFW